MLPWISLLLFVPCDGTNVWLYIQALPNPVLEGESLTLQCQGWNNMALSQVHFYKDGALLHLSNGKKILSIRTATMESSGQFSCSGRVTYLPHLGRETSGTTTVQVQELFSPPVLNAVPSPKLCEGSPLTLRCQTRLHPQRPALRLLFSFYKDGRTVQGRGQHPELHILAMEEGDSGLYWWEAACEGGRVQKRSPQLEIMVQAPVSRPLLTLPHRIISPAVGDLVELFCEVQRGSPPILCSFYLDGKLLGNHSDPHGGAASLLVPVKSEQDTGNDSCEAENSVSRERSESRKISLKGSQVLSTPTHCNWPVVYLPAGLLGVMVIAAALLGYFKPWKKAGPLPSQDLPPAPGGEQCPFYGSGKDVCQDHGLSMNVGKGHLRKKQALPSLHQQKDEHVTCLVVRTTLKRSKSRPVQLTSEPNDISIICAEVRKPDHHEISPEELSLNHAHPGPLGDYEEFLY